MRPVIVVRSIAAFFVAILFFVTFVRAQTPNTASLQITVVDQNGAVIEGASVTVQNSAIGSARTLITGNDGTVSASALSLTGVYVIKVMKTGFAESEIKDVLLRSGETANIRVSLAIGSIHPNADVTILGTADGVRADSQIGQSIDIKRIDETPLLGRKFSSLPLLNSAFRQGKGTGDLFVNQTYFITGVGSRRAATFTLDGASNDEGWGRQTAVATVPVGAVQEVAVLTNAFSSEYGWTSGPALNIVTKSGTNDMHGEAVFVLRPGDGWQSRSFSTKGYCPKSAPSCVVPSTLTAIDPVDIPDQLSQYSGAVGGPIIRDRTFFFLAADHTRQNRTAFISGTLPSFVLPANGDLAYEGHYRQTLFDGRIDHRFTDKQTLMFRVNFDRFFDDNPQDAVGGSNAPSVARRYSRKAWTAQGNLTTILTPELVNEVRVSYLHGDPVTLWEPKELSTTYTRAGSVPFTIGQSRASDIYSYQFQVADTLSWSTGRHYLRIGGNVTRHRSGGTGNEPGTPILGTFTFRSNTTAPFGQLTLPDVQNYQQPINFGIDSYDLTQWLYASFVQDHIRVRHDLSIDLGLRYDRQTLTDASKNFAPRIGFAWNPMGDSKTVIRGGYGMYYTQIRTNAVASYLVNGLDGLTTYSATSGQTGFPTCLTCAPVNVDPRTIPANQLPARDIVIKAGLRSFYQAQFARYGLNFDLLPNYPDKLVNPRSQVFTIGAEHEFFKGLFAGADYVRQHLSNIDRTVDLNAPSAFDRTAPGQVRSVSAANATRPILPVNGGIRQVNALINFGKADYDGLQTQVSYRGKRRIYLSTSYTLSKATNTTEPDGNGIAPNQAILSRLGEEERGPSVVDQRHRAVLTFIYRFPWNITAGTVTQLASARPFNATTGIDNNGDGSNNDRPVIDGKVMAKSAFRGTGTQDVSVFVSHRIRLSETAALVLRIEGFNIFNHVNMLGRGQTIYSTVVGGLDTATPRTDFGAFSTTYTNASRTNAIPAFANIDPPRMFQLQARFVF